MKCFTTDQSGRVTSELELESPWDGKVSWMAGSSVVHEL